MWARTGAHVMLSDITNALGCNISSVGAFATPQAISDAIEATGYGEFSMTCQRIESELSGMKVALTLMSSAWPTHETRVVSARYPLREVYLPPPWRQDGGIIVEWGAWN